MVLAILSTPWMVPGWFDRRNGATTATDYGAAALLGQRRAPARTGTCPGPAICAATPPTARPSGWSATCCTVRPVSGDGLLRSTYLTPQRWALTTFLQVNDSVRSRLIAKDVERLMTHK
jgi:hypothetical protein